MKLAGEIFGIERKLNVVIKIYALITEECIYVTCDLLLILKILYGLKGKINAHRNIQFI